MGQLNPRLRARTNGIKHNCSFAASSAGIVYTSKMRTRTYAREPPHCSPCKLPLPSPSKVCWPRSALVCFHSAQCTRPSCWLLPASFCSCWGQPHTPATLWCKDSERNEQQNPALSCPLRLPDWGLTGQQNQNKKKNTNEKKRKTCSVLKKRLKNSVIVHFCCDMNDS